MKNAKKKRQSQTSRDPKSYTSRMSQARKANNEFSKLLRPPQGWVDRFGFYSCYAKRKSPYKWDFIW